MYLLLKWFKECLLDMLLEVVEFCGGVLGGCVLVLCVDFCLGG